ncbi:NAD-dependent epimerase/dehydratase family protein [Bradyrhizobium erythrophlei]|uniref:NAD-dependent epimerase/dehydratase family protein n=1 Tax=Bradyrhizobium erythrophlei TaxID=1437360 RepID=UPI0035E86BC4
MRVMLTGFSGWLGRFLAPRLRQEGHVVVGLDVVAGEATDVIGSVADRSVIDKVFADHSIEAVIHAGALHKPDIVRFPPQAFVDANVSGTLNLLQAAVAAGHDRFVMTSTTSLMISQAIRDGDGHAAVWLDETTGPLEPRNIYGVTLERASGFEIFVISAPTPFARDDVATLKSDAADVIARYFPEAPALFARRSWHLPKTIGRIYDPGKAERLLGFRARTDFAAVLRALRAGVPLPFAHDPDYVSPSTRLANG